MDVQKKFKEIINSATAKKHFIFLKETAILFGFLENIANIYIYIYIQITMQKID